MSRASARHATLVFAVLLGWGAPSPADADWLFVPVIGRIFDTQTNLFDLERATERPKWVYGGTVTFQGPGVVGVELDVAYSPGFFQRERAERTVLRSRMTTIFGSAVIAPPLEWTRESLRPYVSVGLGVIRPLQEDLVGALPVHGNLLGFSVGAGFIGFFTDRTGMRLDLRRFSNLTDGPEGIALGMETELRLWRATIGLVLR